MPSWMRAGGQWWSVWFCRIRNRMARPALDSSVLLRLSCAVASSGLSSLLWRISHGDRDQGQFARQTPRLQFPVSRWASFFLSSAIHPINPSNPLSSNIPPRSLGCTYRSASPS